MDAVAFYGQDFHMRCIKMVFSQTLILGKYLQHFVEFFFAENFTFNAESLRERKLCYHGLDENKFHDEFGCYSTPGSHQSSVYEAQTKSLDIYFGRMLPGLF